MRKTIAVIVEEIWSPYTREILSGIFDYFKNRDVDILVSLLRLPNFREDTFDYQYMAATELLKTKEIDSIILVSPSFCANIPMEKLENFFSGITEKKIISIGMPMNISSAVSIQVSCENTYIDITKHLIEKHGAKKIAFASAEIDKSEEARQRLDAYKNALKVNNLEYDEDLVYYGRFVFEGAAEAFAGRLNTKEDVKFDTIFAANDMLALGCISYLEDLGLRVPEDVKVVGYDDILMSATYRIPLSTINAQLVQLAHTAGMLAEKAANGEEVRDTFVDALPVYRTSCGCQYTADDSNLVKDAWSLKTSLDHEAELTRLYSLLDTTESNQSLETLFKRLPEIMDWIKIPFIAVCLYDESVTYNPEQPFKRPETAKMAFCVDLDQKNSNYGSGYDITLKDKFWPNIDVITAPDTYVFEPIFYGKEQYGYIISRLKLETLSFLSVCIKSIANEIVHAYEYSRKLKENSKLHEENMSLNVRSYIEELTGLFNRRGLMHYADKSITESLKVGKKGSVLYCDMDHLKLINDKYGHEWGDKAIKAEAEILKRTFRGQDLICRMGGDEFVVVAPGLDVAILDSLRARMDKISVDVKNEKELPFDVRLSIGGVGYSDDNRDIEKLIKDADKEQYKQKEEHHRIYG